MKTEIKKNILKYKSNFTQRTNKMINNGNNNKYIKMKQKY